MKLILISDLHGQPKTLNSLRAVLESERFDGLICSGDITYRDEVGFLNEFFAILKGKGVDAALIWGNSDEARSQEIILNSPYNCHLEQKKIGAVKIYGVSYSEEPILPDSQKIKGNILVTHKPPLKNQLKRPLSNAPKIHISGHIHSAKQMVEYPCVTHIQVPSLILRQYAVLSLPDIKVEFRYSSV